MAFVARAATCLFAFALSRAALSARLAAFLSRAATAIFVSRTAGRSVLATGCLSRTARISRTARSIGLATFSARFAAGHGFIFRFRFRRVSIVRSVSDYGEAQRAHQHYSFNGFHLCVSC